MNVIDKLKQRINEVLCQTPRALRPSVKSLLWLTSAFGLVKREKYIFARMGFPDHIKRGPFVGMKYFPVSHGSALLPKILGTYEKELHPYIFELSANSWDIVVDVGAAEGFYAIGLSLLLRPKMTFCYDTNLQTHRTLQKLATINSVDQVIRTNGVCTTEELQGILKVAERPLVFMDCEGGEYDLLDLVKVPDLSRSWVIVELHGWKAKDDTLPIELKFKNTHRIVVIPMEHRTAYDAIGMAGFNADDQLRSVFEHRVHMDKWLVMYPINT